MTYLNQSRKALWSVATLITLSVYTGITVWLLHSSPIPSAEAAPAAMMIELAAVPVAQVVEQDLQVAPDKLMQKQISTPSAKPPKEVVKKSRPPRNRHRPNRPNRPLRTPPTGPIKAHRNRERRFRHRRKSRKNSQRRRPPPPRPNLTRKRRRPLRRQSPRAALLIRR